MSRLLGNLLSAYAIYRAWKQRRPKSRSTIQTGTITVDNIASGTITAAKIPAMTYTTSSSSNWWVI
jgi:hypothetical protein